MNPAIFTGKGPNRKRANDPCTSNGNSSDPATTHAGPNDHQDTVGSSAAPLSAGHTDKICDWDATIAVFESRETLITELCSHAISKEQKLSTFLDKFGFMLRDDYIRLTGRKISDKTWLRLAGPERQLTRSNSLSGARFGVIDEIAANERSHQTDRLIR